MSIADLAYCNCIIYSAIAYLTPLFLANFDFNGFPIIQQYIETLLAIPEVREAHAEFFKFVGGRIPVLNDFIKKQIQLWLSHTYILYAYKQVLWYQNIDIS